MLSNGFINSFKLSTSTCYTNITSVLVCIAVGYYCFVYKSTKGRSSAGSGDSRKIVLSRSGKVLRWSGRCARTLSTSPPTSGLSVARVLRDRPVSQWVSASVSTYVSDVLVCFTVYGTVVVLCTGSRYTSPYEIKK